MARQSGETQAGRTPPHHRTRTSRTRTSRTRTRRAWLIGQHVVLSPLTGLVAFAGVAMAFVLSPIVAEPDAVDATKPDATPTFETHRARAEAICKGPVVRSGPGYVAEDVVVVRHNGDVELMDVTEAWNRNSNDNYADNVWAIALCAADAKKTKK